MARMNGDTHAFWHTANDRYDIVSFQEPWWGEIGGGQRGAVNPGPGWRCILPVRAVKQTERPRVLTFYRIRAGMSVVPRYDIVEDLDVMVVEVRQQGRRPILVCTIYNQTPLQDDQAVDDRRRRSQLQTTIQRTIGQDFLRRVPRDLPVVFSGDFNLHHPMWETMVDEPTAEARNFVAWIQEHGFTILNETDEPTFFSRSSTKRSVLDLTFVNRAALRDGTVKDWHIDPASTISSDHAGLRWTFDPAQMHVDSGAAGQYNWKKADVALFQKTLREELDKREALFAPLRDRLAWIPPALLDAAVAAFHEALRIAAEKAVPRRNPSTHSKPFWDAELDTAKEAAEAAKLAYSTASYFADDDVLEGLAKTWEHQAKRLRRTIRKKKRDFYRGKLESSTTKDMWEFPRWTKGQRQYPTPPIYKGEDLPPATEHAEKCAALRAALFAPPPDLGHTYPDLSTVAPDAAEYFPVTREEVFLALVAPDPDSAPGPTGETNRALCWAWVVADDEMALIVIHCAHTGYHPTLWCRSIAAALRKPGKPDYTKPRAHRLIHCLECMGKSLERIKAKRIAFIAMRRGLIAETQFGGVPGRSVDDAGLTFTHDVETAAKRGLATSALTFDITGYFDRVSHPRLLAVLHAGGLPLETVRWVASFLSDRQTALRLDGEVGEMAPVETGIPQGSPVSPILAAIFSKTLDARIRDASARIRDELSADDDAPTLGKLIMFVDDGKLYVASKSLDTNIRHIQALYAVAEQWARDEGLVLDDEKRDFTHFTASMHKLDGVRLRDVERPALRLPTNAGGVATLEPAATYRWLGIHWDPRLSFRAHVGRMAARAGGVVDALLMLGNTMSGLSPLCLRSIHIACTMSILLFGAAVWFTGVKQKGHVQTLEVVMRRAMRQIVGAFKTTPTDVLNIETSIPPLDLVLQSRRERAALRFARMPGTHPIMQRLGRRWHLGAVAENPPPLRAVDTRIENDKSQA